MRTLFLLSLAASLAVNGWLVWDISHASAPAIRAQKPIPRPPPAAPALWTTLEDNEPSALGANLRTAGLPEPLVQAIVRAQVRNAFAARRLALAAQDNSRAFWKSAPIDAQQQAAIRALRREEVAALRLALGPEADMNGAFAGAFAERGLSKLSSAQSAAVRRTLEDFSFQREEITAAMSAAGPLSAADRASYLALEKSQHDALARILSPAELEDYDLRTGNTALALRNRLSAFAASEDEFRSIARLQQTFDENFGFFAGARSPEETKLRAAAQRELTGQIVSALGPERGAEYQLTTQDNYRLTAQLVTRLALPPETTKKIWSVQDEFTQRAASLSAAERPALAAEASARLTAVLGPDGLAAYKQYAGAWLQNLTAGARPKS